MLATAAAACAIAIATAEGAELARVPVPQARFEIRYRHSVTRRMVESHYALLDGALVQVAEVFDEHGPGMAVDAASGERWTRAGSGADARFVLHMKRPLAALVLRAQSIAEQRLVANGEALDLARWGERPLRLVPQCAAGASPAAR